MRRWIPAGWSALALTLLLPAPVHAEDPAGIEEDTSPAGAEETAPAASAAASVDIPTNRLYVADLTVMRLNPLGLETQNRLVFQHRLMDSDSVLFRDTFVNAGAGLKLNPAYLKVGPLVEIQPIALLHVRLGYEFVQYFGSFGYLQSFPTPSSDYSDAALDAGDAAGEAYVTNGSHVFVEPTLQVKVGSVVVRSKTAIEYWDLNLEPSTDTAFYDATLDTLIPDQGMVLANDSDLLWLASEKLVLGVRWSGVKPFYADAPDENKQNGHQRVGPMMAYSFHTRNYTRFNRPTLLAITGWYVDHPNRGGAIPYFLLGFAFTSDLLNPRD